MVAKWLVCWNQAQKGLGSNRSHSCRLTVLGKLFTPSCLCSPSSEIVVVLLRVARVVAGLVESTGSLPPGSWFMSPAGWLARTGISSRTLHSVIEYGLLIYTDTHTHPFDGPFSGTTQVSRYQKGKPIWILLKRETVSGSGISWAMCKSAPCSRRITMPAPHHSVFYRPDALPAAQPTASKHWRHGLLIPLLKMLIQDHKMKRIQSNRHAQLLLHFISLDCPPGQVTAAYTCLAGQSQNSVQGGHSKDSLQRLDRWPPSRSSSLWTTVQLSENNQFWSATPWQSIVTLFSPDCGPVFAIVYNGDILAIV